MPTRVSRLILRQVVGKKLACGVGGKMTVELGSGAETNVKTFDSAGLDLKRFDTGLDLGIAAEFE